MMKLIKHIVWGLLALVVLSSFSYGVESAPTQRPSREGMDAPTLSAEPPSSSTDSSRRRANDTATVNLLSESDSEKSRGPSGSGLGSGGGGDDGDDPGPGPGSFIRRWLFRSKSVELTDPPTVVIDLDTFITSFQDRHGTPPSPEDMLKMVMTPSSATHVQSQTEFLPKLKTLKLPRIGYRNL